MVQHVCSTAYPAGWLAFDEVNKETDLMNGCKLRHGDVLGGQFGDQNIFRLPFNCLDKPAMRNPSKEPLVWAFEMHF